MPASVPPLPLPSQVLSATVQRELTTMPLPVLPWTVHPFTVDAVPAAIPPAELVVTEESWIRQPAKLALMPSPPLAETVQSRTTHCSLGKIPWLIFPTAVESETVQRWARLMPTLFWFAMQAVTREPSSAEMPWPPLNLALQWTIEETGPALRPACPLSVASNRSYWPLFAVGTLIP